MASAVAPWALKRAEAIGSRRFDGVGQRLRGGVTSLVFGRRGHRLGAHSGAVAAHCAAVEARDGTVSRAARGASWNAVEVIRRTIVEAEPSGPGHPPGWLGLTLLEEDMQHVRLNIVWVGTDGRCAELERVVQWRPRSGVSPPPWSTRPPPTILAALFSHILMQRGPSLCPAPNTPWYTIRPPAVLVDWTVTEQLASRPLFFLAGGPGPCEAGLC
jgi:hypothetical protein